MNTDSWIIPKRMGSLYYAGSPMRAFRTSGYRHPHLLQAMEGEK